MTPQYLKMTPQWDPVFQAPSNQQPLRYRFQSVTGYSGPSFDPYLPWLGPIVPTAYIDLLAVYNNPGGSNQQTPNIGQNPGFVIQGTNGKPLFLNWNCSGGSCPQYCGDPTNPAFVQYQQQMSGTLIQKGYGLYLDDVDLNIVTTDGTGNPVLPAGVDAASWAYNVVGMVERIRQAFPSTVIIHNAAWNSAVPQDAIVRMIKAADYQNQERGFADPNLNAATTLGQMLYIDQIHSLGRKVIQENLTSVQNGQSILPYLLNMFRVTMQPGDLFCVEDLVTPDPSLDIDTGTPYARAQIGPYQYARQFSNGWAVVDINAKTGSWTPSS